VLFVFVDDFLDSYFGRQLSELVLGVDRVPVIDEIAFQVFWN
jgi:hypothetical protein